MPPQRPDARQLANLASSEWKELPEYEYWTATYNYECEFANVTEQFLTEKVAKRVSPAFGDGRWHISIGTIAKAEGYLGVFLGAAQDPELQTSKQWVRRCVKCAASLGTPRDPVRFGENRNISGGYTFSSALESRRGQAKYYKLDRLLEDDRFQQEQALFVTVELEERRRTLRPSPFGDIRRFASTIRNFSVMFDDPSTADIVFVFPRARGASKNPKTVYAQKRILRSVPYFDDMFNSGFAESAETQSQDGDSIDITMDSERTPTLTSPKASPLSEASRALTQETSSDSSYLDDSDLELDDAEDGLNAVEFAAGSLSLDSQPQIQSGSDTRPAKKRRYSEAMPLAEASSSIKGRMSKITITGTAYTTYRALIQYIYTNSILFAPLRSTYLINKERQDLRGRKVTQRRSQWSREYGVKFSLVLDASELEPTSPKSMYVLADMLQMQELRDEALKQYMRNLTAENICAELQSPFASKYDAITTMAFTFLRQHWKLVNATNGWRVMLEDGFSTLAPALRTELIKFLSTLEVPVDEPIQDAE